LFSNKTLSGVYTIADDLLIVGEGDSHSIAMQDPDKKLEGFLERCRIERDRAQ
jgi:hypothetical protein